MKILYLGLILVVLSACGDDYDCSNLNKERTAEMTQLYQICSEANDGRCAEKAKQMICPRFKEY